MTYEVELRPIPRSRRPLVIPPLIAIAVVAAALIAGPTPDVNPSPTDGPVATDPPPLDATLTACRALRPLPCRDTVRAA